MTRKSTADRLLNRGLEHVQQGNHNAAAFHFGRVDALENGTRGAAAMRQAGRPSWIELLQYTRGREA